MNRFLRGAALAALTLAASTALATASSAQSYGRLVVFGDSLSDNGNLVALGAAPPAPYFQGRFSNGPVFTELLGFNAGRVTAGASVAGSINNAFGGARTDSQASPPGMRAQLATYASLGGVFGANDLVSVLGGANNIFQSIGQFAVLPPAQQGNPTGFVTPAIAGAIGDMTFIVDSIAQRGAGTILVTNLPRLGTTPQFSTTPVAGLADFAGSQFNAGLLTSMLTVANARPGTNIILFDVAKIGDTLAANPGRFGLTNVTQACFNGVSVCANPDSFLFWDGVHPTAAGHRLFAALADDYLSYADRGASATLQGETAYRHREDGLTFASDRLSGREPWVAGTSLSVGALYDTSETDARGRVSSSTADSYGARIMLESGTEALRFGLAGSYRNADVEAGAASFELQTLALDLYGGWRSGRTFVNAAVGVANEDFNDIERISGLAPITQIGSTRGLSSGARAQAGMWFDAGGIAVSPRVAVTWASSEVDGYTEQGFAASYQYGDREVKGITGEVALRAETTMGGFGIFAEGGYRDSLDDSSEAVRVGISNNPARVLSREFEDPFGGSLLASVGINGKIGAFDLEVGYRGRFGDSGISHTGGITLTLPMS